MRVLSLAIAVASLVTLSADAQAQAVRSGFDSSTLAANDDGSTGLVPLGFTVDFFGLNFSSAHVNNNGNVTFDSALFTFTPFDLTSTGRQIIAPFFADVDTRADSNPVRYGAGTVDGRSAWGATWDSVNCFSTLSTNPPGTRNTFQVVLIERFDTGPGNFDIEFNYDQIVWEAGQASGGTNACLGGSPARVGFSNGSGAPGSFFELPGSGVNGAFLDSNLMTGLIHNSLNSSVLGRYVFSARQGTIVVNDPPVCDAGGPYVFECGGATTTDTVDASLSSDPEGTALTYSWATTCPGGTFDDATLVDPDLTVDSNPAGFSCDVAVLVTDADGLTDDCFATVDVVDTTPPMLDPAADVDVVSCSDTQTVYLTAPAASDSCAGVVVDGEVIESNGAAVSIPVVGGMVTLPIGTHIVEWTATDDAGLTASTTAQIVVEPGIVALHQLRLGDRVTTSDLLASFGTSELGADATSGSIYSVGQVTLRNRATVNGDVRTEAGVTAKTDSVVTGSTDDFLATVNLPAVDTSVGMPAGGPGVVVNSGSTQTLAPGSYGQVIVNANATLILENGSYEFNSFMVNDGSTLQHGDTSILAKNFTFRGTQVSYGALSVDIKTGGWHPVGADLVADLRAPNGTLAIGGNVTVEGQLLGRSIVADPDASLVCVD